MITDTHPKTEQLHLELMRQTPLWRKAQMLGEMYQTMKQLSYSGLRQCYPKATETELRRRLADLLLGPDLAAQV